MDLSEGGEGLVCVWLVWEDCKGECFAFIKKASPLPHEKD